MSRGGRLVTLFWTSKFAFSIHPRSLYMFSGFPIYCLNTVSIKIEKNVIQEDTNVKLLEIRLCIRHRAILYSQLLGSPERNDSSPHLAASTNNPAGDRHLAKLLRLKKWNPGWGEEGRRDNWRGR